MKRVLKCIAYFDCSRADLVSKMIINSLHSLYHTSSILLTDVIVFRKCVYIYFVQA